MARSIEAAFEREVRRAVRPYTAPILFLYDVGVYDLWNPYVWRCPSERVMAFYRRHVREVHLEAGCGTGYLPDHCGPKQAWQQRGTGTLTLLDFSPSSLRWSEKRLHAVRPATLRHNLFEPLPAAAGQFDSICLNYVLHCLPGDFERKGAVIGHLKQALRPGGVLFGSTILGNDETPGNLGKRMLDFYNLIGSFHNAHDTKRGLVDALSRHFPHVHCEVEGAVALFAASDAPL